MSQTKRHHFIPEFYLKHFTNENNQFYIYLVKENKFKDRGRLFYPSQQFYEHYGNTVTYGQQQSDWIEKSFSDIDSKVGAIIKKISAGREWTLEEEEWIMLQYFVNIIYWRIPANTEKVKEYISNATCLSDFKMKVTDVRSGEQISTDEEMKLLERIKRDPDFYKFLKLMLPANTFPEIFNKPNRDFAHIFPFTYADRLPKLVSDNPIIYRRPGKESLHTDEFIFPITPTQLLFRHRFSKLIVHSHVRLYVDMLLLLQANEYVSCTDLQYPALLKSEFQIQFGSIEKLRENIFNLIYQKIG